MSLLTRCPVCATCYRVVPDQLLVGQGWVRCGQCAEVFDATANSVDSVSPSRPDHQATPNAAVPASTYARDEPGSGHENLLHDAAPSSSSSDDLNDKLSNHAAQTPAPRLQPSQADAVLESGIGALKQASKDQVQDAVIDFDMGLNPKQSVDSLDQLGPDHHDWSLNIVPDQVTFLKPDKKQVPTRGVFAVCLWALLSAGLVLVLLAQFVHRERDTLALKYPQLQPVLQFVCTALNCQIEPLRRIDALIIDASSLTAAGNSAYRLNMVIKNQADLPVAFPGIELTLIDALDQVLVRRTFLPKDLGARHVTLGVSQSWPVDLGLEFTGSPSVSGVVGYRLLAFYP